MKANTQYWTPLLDDVIVEYNNSTDEFERDQLYRDHLDVPIRKLVECIVAKYLGGYKDREVVEEDTLHHLVLQLRKYDRTSGRSFSYFTKIATHYVWQYNMSKKKNDTRLVSIQGIQFLMAVQVEDYYGEYHDDTPDTNYTVQWPEALKVFTPTPEEVTRDPLLVYLNRNDTCGGKKERDKKIVDALRFIFNNAEEHPTVNKKAMFEKIRQRTGSTTLQISNTIHRIKKNFESNRCIT